MRPWLLPFLENRDRHVAQPSRQLRLLLEQLPQPDRAREPRRPPSHDQDADLDPLAGRVGGRRDVVRRVEGGRVVGGLHEPLRARINSVSFGTISCRSPTTPRSLNSKIGAFASLLIATITPAPCMPTLCWIAPEIPQATYSFGDTVFPVWPTWVAYGYQPASTTARVAATAPPSAFASSSARENASGEPRPRPPATITSASSIDGPLCSSCACSTISARVEKSSSCGSTRRTSASPPDSVGSKAPARKSARRGVDVQPTSHTTVSERAGCVPTRPPSRSTTSVSCQFRPASRRAASAAATSAERIDEAKKTLSKPPSPMTWASTSTRGCGSGASTSPPSWAAFESTASDGFSSSPSWCSRNTSVLNASPCSSTRRTGDSGAERGRGRRASSQQPLLRE